MLLDYCFTQPYGPLFWTQPVPAPSEALGEQKQEILVQQESERIQDSISQLSSRFPGNQPSKRSRVIFDKETSRLRPVFLHYTSELRKAFADRIADIAEQCHSMTDAEPVLQNDVTVMTTNMSMCVARLAGQSATLEMRFRLRNALPSGAMIF